MSLNNTTVRIKVTASFIVTLGLYEADADISAIAENVDDLLHVAGGIEDFIDRVDILELTRDNGNIVISSTDA
jgi:hypothetical protein